MASKRLIVLLAVLAVVLIMWFAKGKEDLDQVLRHEQRRSRLADLNPGWIQYVEGDDHPHRTLDIHAARADEPAPVVIFVHGGGWAGGTPATDAWGLNAGEFRKRGVVLVGATHRSNNEVKHPGLSEDVAAAVAWVHENIADYGGDPQRIFLAGHSSGAHLVSLVALDPAFLEAHGLDPSALRGVIHLSGLVDLTFAAAEPGRYESIERYVGHDPERLRNASPLHHLGEGRLPPFLIVYGEQEGEWMRATSEEFRDALIEEGGEAEAIEMKGANHFSLINFLDPRNAAFAEFIGLPPPADASETEDRTQEEAQ